MASLRFYSTAQLLMACFCLAVVAASTQPNAGDVYVSICSYPMGYFAPTHEYTFLACEDLATWANCTEYRLPQEQCVSVMSAVDGVQASFFPMTLQCVEYQQCASTITFVEQSGCDPVENFVFQERITAPCGPSAPLLYPNSIRPRCHENSGLVDLEFCPIASAQPVGIVLYCEPQVSDLEVGRCGIAAPSNNEVMYFGAALVTDTQPSCMVINVTVFGAGGSSSGGSENGDNTTAATTEAPTTAAPTAQPSCTSSSPEDVATYFTAPPICSLTSPATEPGSGGLSFYLAIGFSCRPTRGLTPQVLPPELHGVVGRTLMRHTTAPPKQHRPRRT